MKLQHLATSLTTACTIAAPSAFATDRLVPSQYATIQTAVSAAVTGDRIVIAPGTYQTSSIIINGKRLTFVAETPHATTIIGSAGAILSVTGTTSVSEVIGLDFQNGMPAINAGSSMRVIDCSFSGGNSGIQHSDGDLFVDRCRFSDATGATNGGGIYVNGDSAVIRRSTFARLSSSYYGGGIRVSAPTTIEYCSFSECTSTYGSAIGHHQYDLVVRGCVIDSCPEEALYLQGSPANLVACSFRASSPQTGGAGPQIFTDCTFCTTSSIVGTWVDGGGNAFNADCSADCDSDGAADIGEWALDASVNCDAAGGLDSCQLAADPDADCTGNGRLDSCDVADGLVGDCDGDGRPDPCQISDGQSDSDGNGVPDGCDPDCDGDGTIDAIEISSGAEDCNGDSVPDTCDQSAVTLFDTGPQRQLFNGGSTLAYLGYSCGRLSTTQLQRWTAQPFSLPAGCDGFDIKSIAVNGYPTNATTVPFLGWKIWVRRPGNAAPVTADLLAEGTAILPAAIDDPRSAPTNERYRFPVDVRLLPGDYWLAVYGVNGNSNSVFVWYGNPEFGVNAFATHMLRADRYPVPGFVPWSSSTIVQAPKLDPADRWNTVFTIEGVVAKIDCDGNGTPDTDQIAANPSLDCDGNLRLDACQPDCDSDGTPDTCEIAGGEPDVDLDGIPDRCECIGDLYVNGRVDGADLGILLSEWGAVTATTVSDLDRNGVVGGSDLGVLLGRWGPCAN